jgi:predicted O-methyltransferase YrrM
LLQPDLPWLTSDSIVLLEQLLRASDEGVEFGSGRSTIWFAKRTRHLVSMEHSRQWHDSVKGKLESEKLGNVDLRFAPADEDNADDPFKTTYINAEGTLAPGSKDYILVDGLYRGECALKAIELLRPGGIIITDNIDWYIPRATRTPFATKEIVGQAWARFVQLTGGWRSIWTSSGVTDTAIWFKPC